MASAVFQPFIIFGEGEQGHPSNDTLASLTRTPTLAKQQEACLGVISI